MLLPLAKPNLVVLFIHGTLAVVPLYLKFAANACWAMDTKVTTVIVNDTKHGLSVKVGNPNCFARLTSIKKGGEYKMQIDVNWTYQEFLMQDKSNQANQLFINSDDCCDYERITIKEVNGKFDVQRDLRKQFRTSSPAIEGSSSGIEDSSSSISGWKLWLYKLIYA